MNVFCFETEYSSIIAGCCNREFFVTTAFRNARLKDKNGFYCPYCGNSRVFTNKTEEEILREKLQEKEEQLKRAMTCSRIHYSERRKLEKALSAQKGVSTRLRKKLIPEVNK